MSLNEIPSANRVHIGFFGCRNAGKSSLINKIANQDISVVSDKKGTTTDPVSKSMEILPLGAVVLTDTPGFDDEGELGERRVSQTKKVLNRSDGAVLVADSEVGLCEYDRELIELFEAKEIPYIVAYNKCDIKELEVQGKNEVAVSALNGDGIDDLLEKIGGLTKKEEKKMLGDLISKGDTAVLVIPIDESAPKGRIILPQQQALRDILDRGAKAVVCRDTEFAETLASIKDKPKLVVTDSQVFGVVSKETPEDIELTSFSILMARYKGFLDSAVAGVCKIDELRDGDTVLIAEACTHRRQCKDIGTVKLPKLLKKHTGADIKFETSSGGGFPEDLSRYSLILHCGGCMINDREMRCRIKCAEDARVPLTNYGTAIAYMNGILERSLKVFPEIFERIYTKK